MSERLLMTFRSTGPAQASRNVFDAWAARLLIHTFCGWAMITLEDVSACDFDPPRGGGRMD
jgi:hypothetical protein